MATGIELQSAWGKKTATLGQSLGMALRKEVSLPIESHWSMQNFWFGVDYAGSATNKTLNDTPAVDANIVQVNGVSVDGTGALGDEWGPGGSNTAVADVNVVSVNGVTVAGTGTLGDEWGP